jgi:hypothetical protein
VSGGETEDPVAQGPSLQSPEVKAYLEQTYQSALANDNQLLAVLTDGRHDLVNYREQLLEAFPGVTWTNRLRLEYFYDCDHSFHTESSQKRLVETVVDWIRKAPFALGALQCLAAAVATSA